MATRNRNGDLIGYSAAIAKAVANDDDAVVDLVEDFMRQSTGGCLDALDARTFARLARQTTADILAWQLAGDVNGTTLANYCDVMGLLYPDALDQIGTIIAVNV